MAKYIIEGGRKLNGKVRISGNKNAALPCLAATLLSSEEVTLNNIPNIRDTEVMVEILKALGAEVNQTEHTVKVNPTTIKTKNPVLPEELASKLRASILLVGPLLSRYGKVEFVHPGGCILGKRTILPHLEGLKELGFKFRQKDDGFLGHKEFLGRRAEKIFLDEASVTATENLIMCAAVGKGKVILKNCASEPHVVDLCNLINAMGGKIEGVGSSTLTITGVEKLGSAEFTIGSDFIELGTYAVAAAITGGEVELENCSMADLEPITIPLRKMGVHLDEQSNGKVKAYGKRLIANPKLHTNIWPGFPSDLASVMIVLATQAKGVTLVHDWMYESRMFFVDKLISMGADITIADPHRVIVAGPTKLKRKELETPDLRAGMALVLAALVGRGISTINKAELIERGYEDVVNNLRNLGANIERVE